jgi:hypothetical protein
MSLSYFYLFDSIRRLARRRSQPALALVVLFMASWSRAAQLLPLGILPPFTDEVPSYPDYASKKSELADDYAEYRDFR